ALCRVLQVTTFPTTVEWPIRTVEMMLSEEIPAIRLAWAAELTSMMLVYPCPPVEKEEKPIDPLATALLSTATASTVPGGNRNWLLTKAPSMLLLTISTRLSVTFTAPLPLGRMNTPEPPLSATNVFAIATWLVTAGATSIPLPE